MLTRKLFRTAWKYKAQFISMVVMVAIGLGIFLGFNIEWYSLEKNAFGFLEETDYADYRLYAEGGFTEDDIEAIRDIDGVDEATRFFNVNAAVADTKKSLALSVSEDYSVSTMMIMEGAEYDEDSDGIWLSDKFAAANGYELGDEMTLEYSGIEITGEIEGFIKSGEHLVCVADENQLMPDYEAFGFAYITPEKLEEALGTGFYPQINIISDLKKDVLEERVKDATGTTLMVSSKDDHVAYAGVTGEAEEGKTMGSILPVLFLAIAILTMVTTMHRISANEKVQIGTLKALGFRDRRILRHYTSYGFVIGTIGLAAGVGIGYIVASLIISPNGMMSTYLDMPNWDLVMPDFCIPVMLGTLALLTLISRFSTGRMLKGNAAEALRPYTPKAMRKSAMEDMGFWQGLSFGTKWNIRDIMRHKSRSLMTLAGVFGCMLLMVGSFGMKDTMQSFLAMLDDDINRYTTKINLTETAANEEAEELAVEVSGDWQAAAGISYEGRTVAMEVYDVEHDMIGFLTEENEAVRLDDDGVYLCLRLADTAEVGETIEFSPYGSEETYEVKVAGYLRSLVSESIVMTADYADRMDIEYHIGTIYTDEAAADIGKSSIIADKQEQQTIMDSYDTFMQIMYIMLIVLIVAAVVLGIVVLYNLGVMSYVERYRELATLKVLGFRDRQIGRLLIMQNIWLTLAGVILGIPGGVVVLQILVEALVSEYEMSLDIGPVTYAASLTLTFGMSLLVSLMVARKNRKIDMVEALKGAE